MASTSRPTNRPSAAAAGFRAIGTLAFGAVVTFGAFVTFASFDRLLAFTGFPKPSGPINDFARLLDAPTIEQLKTLSADVEAETSAEIAVVTVTSLDGMSVEDYANRLFHEWGIGPKATDNGVLILVAPSERKIRIEVGYGLEGVLPDGLAGQIIREEFTPKFKEGDYTQGILLGTKRVAEVVRRNHTVTPEERKRLDAANSNEPPLWLLVPFFAVFVIIGSAVFASGLRLKEGFWLAFGAPFAGFPLLMSLIFSRTTFYIEAALGLLVFLVALLRKEPFMSGLTDDSGSTSRSSREWTWGATSSGSSSGGSSSSSSSSSFGGGSSGGGGASGSW